MSDDSKKIIIARMTIHDADRVIELGTQISQFDTGTNSMKFYCKETLGKMIHSENCIMLTAKKGDEIIGFMLTSVLPDARDAYMHSLFVDKNFRNKGIGSALVEKTMIILEKRPDECNHVFGLVRNENVGTLNFLTNRGFDSGNGFRYIDLMLPREKTSKT